MKIEALRAVRKTETGFFLLNYFPLPHVLEKLRGLVFSQRVLLKLIESGLTREEAYKIVQENCIKTWNNKDSTFLQNLKNDSRVNLKELDSLFEYSYYTKHVDLIFKKAEL